MILLSINYILEQEGGFGGGGAGGGGQKKESANKDVSVI